MKIRKISKIYSVVVCAAFGAAISTSALAGTVDFATQPNATVGDTGVTQITVGDITATAWYDPSDNTVNNWATDVNDATLWRRNNANDHGLGVCSKIPGISGSAEACSSGGNYNELSNQEVDEAIGLNKLSTDIWTELFVSSLDNAEIGTLWWGNSANPNAVINGANSISFGSSVFGTAVEGDLFPYLTANLLALDLSALINSDTIFFTSGGSGSLIGSDNDYLVWKATSVLDPSGVVPIPASVWLFGSGLLGLVGIARRRKGTA